MFRSSVSLLILLSLFLSLSLSPSLLSSSCFSNASSAYPIWQTLPPSQQSLCPSGYTCPNLISTDNTTYVSVCSPPSFSCSQERLSHYFCPPQGLYEPIFINEGFYSADGVTQQECPSGYYCIYGNTAPIACNSLSYCPVGSRRETYYGSLLIVLLVDLGVAMGIWMYRYRLRKSREEKDRNYNEENQNENNKSQTSALPSAESFSVRDSPYFATLQWGFERNRTANTAKTVRFDFSDLSLYLPYEGKSKSNNKNNGNDNANKDKDDVVKGKDDNVINGQKVGKCLLKGVSGKVEPGRVTAVMGPSGAGKTTLLTTLLGRTPNEWSTFGTLKLNGVEKKGLLSEIRPLIAYVPQDDIMMRELTVEENITYSAMIRLGKHGENNANSNGNDDGKSPPSSSTLSSWTNDEISRFVDSIIHVMGLHPYRHHRIGDEFDQGAHLSVDKRKLVNVAIELAGAPIVLLLDEPTSGVSATTSLQLCELLKDLATSLSLTVALVVHQPRIEIFSQLDELLLLAPGGKTVFQGNQMVVKSYFDVYLGLPLGVWGNPADMIMDLIQERGRELEGKWRDGGKVWVEKTQTTTTHKRVEGESSPSPLLEEHANIISSLLYTSSLRGSSFLSQLLLSHLRSLRSQLSQLSSLLIEIIVAMIAGGVMALTLKNNGYLGVLYAPFSLLSASPRETLLPRSGMFLCMGIALAAAAAGVNVIGNEQIIYWREAASGHKKSSYYIGLWSAQLYRNLLGSLHFAFIFHITCTPLIPFSTLFGICFFMYCSWYAWSSIWSSLSSRENSALISVVGALIWSVSGGYVTAIPPVVTYLSSCYWGADAFFSEESSPFLGVMQVNSISAKIWNYHLGRVSFDMGMMICTIIAYHGIGYLAMVRTNREKQR